MESKKLRLYEYDKIIPKELNLNFSLSELEQKIFSFFISNNLNNSTFRVAGGWVRDKILSILNDDIDITIDNISGQEYIKSLSQLNSDTSKIYKILKIQTKNLQIFKQLLLIYLEKILILLI